MRKYYYPSEIHPKSCKSLATELAFNRELHQVVSTVFLLTYGADNDLTEAREEWARYRKRPRSWTHPSYTPFLNWVFCDPPSLYPVTGVRVPPSWTGRP